MRLKDRVVIVTGSARGIGKAYAKRFAEEGAKIVITDVLDPQPAAEELRSAGAQVLALTTDVADEKSTIAMAEQTVATFGRIDVLVNNAAVFADLPLQNFWDISAEEWDLVMTVNVKGLFLCVKAVLPQFREQGKGKIINISSGTVFKGTPLMLHYVSSKGAVVAFTRCLAREMGPLNVNVNAIAPGYTLSEGVLAHPEHVETMNDPVMQTRSFKRSQEPEDLVGTMIYLASDDSDFVTGQTIAVDGGSVMH